MQDIKEIVRKYILAEFLPGEAEENLQDDTPLRTSGVLDSLAVIKLISFVEDKFGIELAVHETGVEYFDSVESIANLVSAKQAAKK